jgi:hypothetical protein
MAPKKKLYTEQNSSRSETAPEVIESDPNNMRRDPNIEESDSLRLFADGEPPSPNSPVDFRASETSSYHQFREEQAAITAARQQHDEQLNADKVEAARIARIRILKNKAEGELMRLAALELGINFDDDEELSQSSVMTEKLPEPLPITAINDPIIKKRSADHLDKNIWISNHEKAIVITNSIDSTLATRFLAYYERPEIINQHHDYKTVIHEGAIDRIQLRLRSGAFSSLVRPEDIDTFPVNADGTVLELVEIARIIKKLYGKSAQESTITTLEQQCKDHCLRYNIKEEQVEDDSLIEFSDIIKNSLSVIDPDMEHTLAVTLGNKLPPNSGMAKEFKLRTKEALVNGLDTVKKALTRIKILISEKREHSRQAQLIGPDSYLSVVDEKDRTVGKQYAEAVPVRTACAPVPSNKSKCIYCGGYHNPRYCAWRGHTLSNKSAFPWEKSHAGKFCLAAGWECITIGMEVPGHPKLTKEEAHFIQSNKKPNYNNNQNTSNSSNGRNQQYNHNNNNNREQQSQYNNNNNNNNRSQSRDNHNNNNNNYNQETARHPYFDNVNKKQRSKSEPDLTCSSLTLPITTEYLNVSVSLIDQMNHPPHRQTDTALSKELTSSLTTNPNQTTTTTRAAPTPAIKCSALLDSGSIAGNFINAELLNALNGHSSLYKTNKPLRVCSGLDNHCLDSADVIDILVEILTVNIKISFILTCHITSSGPIPLIIGRDSIKENNLVTKFPKFFFNTDTLIQSNDIVLEKTKENNRQTHSRILPCECDTISKPATNDSVPSIMKNPTSPEPNHHSSLSHNRRVHFDDTPLIGKALAPLPALNDALYETHDLITEVPEEFEQLSRAEIIGSDEIDNDSKDMFSPFMNTDDTTDLENDFLTKMVIEGCEELQDGIRKLCIKYKSIFRNTIGSEPADIPPFDLDVDIQKWEMPRNRLPVRSQSREKQVEILKQINIMLELGIIEKSTASYYSQVMMTPKKDGTWRFCADYRNINDCTRPASWPLGKALEILARIGASWPDIFAIMDLTTGYHQAALALAARKFTAFITYSGIYQFKRLPFGPKRAPSYFQEMMSSVVLNGLNYFICEMYIDDCILYATGTEQFLERLEILFKRFQEKNIFLKASKCKFGLPKVEYIGREISKVGISMSKEKINTVLDFPTPINNTSLRSFLGLANYFRDFVPNHSNVVNPLHKMIDYSASKRAKITWTPEGEKAFNDIKLLISNSPT